MITKLQFSLAITFAVTFTSGVLAGHTTDPSAWVLPILCITGGTLYASRRLADQIHSSLQKLQSWLRHSGLSQGTPRLLHPANWKKP